MVNVYALLYLSGVSCLAWPESCHAKVDIESTYHQVPVHPDCPLQGMHEALDDQLYIDLILTFGHCLVPKIFTAIPCVLIWCFEKCAIAHIHHCTWKICGCPQNGGSIDYSPIL